MKTVSFRWGSSLCILPTFLLFLIMVATAQADQVDMQNGDRYSGKIVALESNTVVLNSEMVGTVRLRRDQIRTISMGAAPAAAAPSTNTVPKAPPVPVVSPAAGPNPQINLNSSVSHQIAANPNLVQEVRNQVLAGAGPKATQKYDAIVSGLSSGELNISDLRKEAASVAAQLRQLGGGADEESAAIFDQYLSILDSFVEQTDAAIGPTNKVPSAPPAASTPAKPLPSK